MDTPANPSYSGVIPIVGAYNSKHPNATSYHMKDVSSIRLRHYVMTGIGLQRSRLPKALYSTGEKAETVKSLKSDSALQFRFPDGSYVQTSLPGVVRKDNSSQKLCIYSEQR